jgi:IMP dehydrogenase/GMP reductase
MLFDFDDILIEPATLSPIRSRKEINPKYDNGYYPLMTAPMDTVISSENHQLFKQSGIFPVLPRSNKFDSPSLSDSYFTSYGLDEFIFMFIDNEPIKKEIDKPTYVLIDVANGHMEAVYNAAKQAKDKYGDKLVLMVGNVANPTTFERYCMIGVDYVRIGIGNGGGCLTTVQTGVGYPMASLIETCSIIRDLPHELYKKTKIVADGGFKKYSDVIKALAIGADYVMLGSMLNKCLESWGETSKEDGTWVNQFSKDAVEMLKCDIPLYKNFRGMSTKEVQQSWGRTDLKTSEGVVKRQKVEYTLQGWVDNFESYLRSAMSYTGKRTIEEYVGKVDYNMITQNSFRRFDK